MPEGVEKTTRAYYPREVVEVPCRHLGVIRYGDWPVTAGIRCPKVFKAKYVQASP